MGAAELPKNGSREILARGRSNPDRSLGKAGRIREVQRSFPASASGAIRQQRLRPARRSAVADSALDRQGVRAPRPARRDERNKFWIAFCSNDYYPALPLLVPASNVMVAQVDRVVKVIWLQICPILSHACPTLLWDSVNNCTRVTYGRNLGLSHDF